MITLQDVLTSSGNYPERLLWRECTDEVKENAEETARRVSNLLEDYLRRCVSSGFRDTDSNKRVGGSEKSSHKKGCALDLFSLAHFLKKDWLKNKGESLLDKHDLYMEDPGYTPEWCHLQTTPTRSGKRVFIP